MRNKTTFLKISSLIFSLVVFFFATVLKLGSVPMGVFVSEDKKVDDFDKVCSVEDDLSLVQGVVIGDAQKSVVNSLFLVDFDDLEYTFTALSVSAKRAFFFQNIIETYSFIVYRKVRLFLFYSFIKIPVVFL